MARRAVLCKHTVSVRNISGDGACCRRCRFRGHGGGRRNLQAGTHAESPRRQKRHQPHAQAHSSADSVCVLLSRICRKKPEEPPTPNARRRAPPEASQAANIPRATLKTSRQPATRPQERAKQCAQCPMQGGAAPTAATPRSPHRSARRRAASDGRAPGSPLRHDRAAPKQRGSSVPAPRLRRSDGGTGSAAGHHVSALRLRQARKPKRLNRGEREAN